jgi:branched-chain amino acid transport system permease protein
MRAIGFPTYRYRLACFVIAGTLCGLAGVLLANHTDFISPAMMHWTRSGDLIIMAVLGGMGSVLGPVVGALALLLLEEVLPGLISAVATFVSSLVPDAATELLRVHLGFGPAANAGEYWQIVMGPLLLLVVLLARGGIDGVLAGLRRG